MKKQGTVTLTHFVQPVELPRKIGTSHCTVTASNLGSTPANVTFGSTSARRASRSTTRTSRLRRSAAPVRADGVHWNGTLSPALAAADHLVTTHGRGARRRVPAAVALRCPAGRGRRRRHDHELQRADVLLRRRAVYEDRRRVERLHRDRRRYGADIVFTPQTFPNTARPNNVIAPLWSDLNPAGPVARSGSATLSGGAISWIVVDWDGVKNFGNADDALVRDLDPAPDGRGGTGPRARDHVLVRPEHPFRDGQAPGTPAPAIRTPARTGAPRTVTARVVRTSLRRRRTATSSGPHTSPAAAGGSVYLRVRLSSKPETARTTRTPR